MPSAIQLTPSPTCPKPRRHHARLEPTPQGCLLAQELLDLSEVSDLGPEQGEGVAQLSVAWDRRAGRSRLDRERARRE